MTKWNKWKTLFCLPWINWWSTASAAVLNRLGGCLTMKRASPFINSATRPCDRAPLPSCERQKRGSRDTPSKDDSVMTSSKHQDSLSIFFFIVDYFYRIEFYPLLIRSIQVTVKVVSVAVSMCLAQNGDATTLLFCCVAVEQSFEFAHESSRFIFQIFRLFDVWL